MSFLGEFLRHPGQVGAIAASSQGLARSITRAAELDHAEVVVEFGPGTGVFTQAILAQLPASADFFTMELSPDFVAATRARCPEVDIVEDSAANVLTHLHARHHRQCDAIVSGLPWAAFPEALQDEILNAAVAALAPGGRFVTFAYLQGVWLPAGQRFKAKLAERFDSVGRTPTVWANLPPAFVYRALTASP